MDGIIWRSLASTHLWQLVIATVLCLWLLKLLYELLQVKWPDFYFSLSEKSSFYVSISPFRFLSFRVIPIVLVTFPILGALAKDNPSTSIILTAVVIGMMHSLSTNGIAVYKLLLGSSSIATYLNKPSQIIHHFFVFLVCCASGLVAGLISTSALGQSISPTLSGLVDNVWSTFFLAIIAVYGYREYKKDVDERRILQWAENKIPVKLVKKIEEACIRANADFELALAVCMIESIQRPLWFRRLEWLKSFFEKPGTYGIMQVASDHYVSDSESIEIAIPAYFSNTKGTLYESKLEAISRYNLSQRYIDTVFTAYSFLCESHGVGYETLDQDNVE